MIAGCLIGLGLPQGPAAAQESAVMLTLRPHCEMQKQEECPRFGIENPVTLKTPVLAVGDTLDIDIIIENSQQQSISRIRSWLTYDPTVLEGQTMELNPQFPTITPGEANFSQTDGYVKIGASAIAGAEPNQKIIAVSRVKFKVKSVPAGAKSAIGFYDIAPEATAHTAVVRMQGTEERNIVRQALGSLLIVLKDGAAASSGAASKQSSVETSASSATSQAASAVSSVRSSVAAERTSFVLLQVQNLRAMTEGSSVYLAWNRLASSDLIGYNVYYGTETGRYIQRRSLDANAVSLALRALPEGTTYFIAVRAVSKEQQESAFSQEVSIQVGNPRSSTAPLTGSVTGSEPQGKNPLNQQKPTNSVPGATGLGSSMLIFLILSAVMGTVLAVRRQWHASAPTHA